MNRALYDFLPVKILYALNDLLFSYLAIFASSLVVMMTVSYMALAQIWVTKLSENIKSGLSLHTGIRVLKEQLILNKIANSVFSGHIMPTYLVGGGFVFAQIIIALVKTYKSQSVAILANLAIAIILMVWMGKYVIDMGGQLWSASLEIKRNLILKGCKSLPSLESRRVMACMEVRIYMRNDFYFKSTTYYSYLDFVLSYVISYILATAS